LARRRFDGVGATEEEETEEEETEEAEETEEEAPWATPRRFRVDIGLRGGGEFEI
jgi:hypothetical protein